MHAWQCSVGHHGMRLLRVLPHGDMTADIVRILRLCPPANCTGSLIVQPSLTSLNREAGLRSKT